MYPILNVSCYPNKYEWSPSSIDNGEISEKLSDVSSFVFVVMYEYFTETYEAHGTMVVVFSDGSTQKYDLSHCSCYGPIDEVGSQDCKISTIEKLLESSDSIHDDDLSLAMKAELRKAGDLLRQIAENKRLSDV